MSFGQCSAAQGTAKIVVCSTQGPNAEVGNMVLAGGTVVTADDGATTPTVPIRPHLRHFGACATLLKGLLTIYLDPSKIT